MRDGVDALLSCPPLTALLPELKSQTKVLTRWRRASRLLPKKRSMLTLKQTPDSYTIRLESDPEGDGANASFLGVLRAKRGGRFSFPEVVKLEGTVAGRFKPTSCRIVFVGSDRVEMQGCPLHCITQPSY